MKNILLIGIVFCLTVLSAILMITTDNESKNSKETKKEKVEQTEQSDKKKDNTQKKQDKEFNIKTQEDLAEIMYSKLDEQTKMNTYNEAIKKGIIPRSDNYQEAVYAYEESVRLKEK